MERFPQRFNRHIDHTKHKVYITFQVFLGLSVCLNHSLTKKVYFPLNSSNDALIGIPSSMCELIMMVGLAIF